MLGNILDFIYQTWPPPPKFTEKELGDQSGKVFIITGSTAGVGKALADILYSKNARVYMATRSADKTSRVMYEIKNHHPTSTGELVFLQLELDDLKAVKRAAEEFLSKEKRLDVLWNNAAVMGPPGDARSKQGYELQFGVMTMGHFLFTKLLTPLLIQTAKRSHSASVRVVWVASSATYLMAPHGGVEMSCLEDSNPFKKGMSYWYGTAKGGMALHNLQFAKLYAEHGILSTSGNPGNLKSELQQHFNWFSRWLMGLISYDPVYGAYTELFAGLSPDLTMEDNGAWIIPWGRVGKYRADYLESAQTKEKGGTGLAEEFWKWSEEQVEDYM